MALPKASQQPGQFEEIRRENSGRDPPGDGACRDSRVAGASQGLRRGRRRGKLSYLAPLGSEKISAPYFKQCLFRGGGITPRD